jgi:hypothetical protein
MATSFLTARAYMAPYVENGVAVSDVTRIDAKINEAQRRLIEQYNFITRREEYEKAALTFSDGGTTGDPNTSVLILDNLDATKTLILALWREENNQLEMAQALEAKAYAFIERNILNEVERQRRTSFQSLASTLDQNTFGGLTGRLGLETMIQYRLPESRIKSFIRQAYQQALDHYNFICRREELDRPQITYSALSNNNDAFPAELPSEIIRLLTLSLMLTDNGGDGTGLKQQAFELVERNITTTVEQSRKAVAGEEGRLHNELPEGVRIPTARLTIYLAQAATEASVHYDFLARREDYAGATKPAPFSFEIRKKLVESYLATSRGALDVAAASKQEAFSIIERDLMAQVESARRATPGDEGRLHNELPEGVRLSTSRIQAYLNQSQQEAESHWQFLARREDYSSGSLPLPFTYEVRKKLVESYVATGAGAVEAASALKAEAQALIERDLMAQVEAARRSTREALVGSDNESFGYHWGRIGLELPEAYRLSNSAVKRMVNAAEEQLMFAGKWVGTVAEYTLSVSATGEFFLPREVETILFLSFDGDPKPVHDRLNEWMRGGTGYRETDDAWRQGAVDRGESIDPADGFLKRKYWITLPNVVPTVRILAKRRFIPHTSDSEKMYLRNYQAIYEATKGILLGGDQITPHIDKAKEMLSGQIAQQSFAGNRGAAHTRRVYQFR